MVDIIPKEINRDDVRTLVRRGANLIEVLPREDYEKIHIAKAISIPLNMFSRTTADRLKWDQPAIVYSRSCLCDLSARAAWRLSSLGFTHIFRYTAGKADWLANGLPVEGMEAQIPRAGDVVDLNVPTCRRAEKLVEVKERLLKEGGKNCVVVNDSVVVLGMLGAVDLERADPSWPAEEAMERDPLTFRLDAALEEVKSTMQAQRKEIALVTSTDGKLFGLLRLGDIFNS
jgi:CBS domain-containing protein/rhodanese-related sulfurtransferase